MIVALLFTFVLSALCTAAWLRHCLRRSWLDVPNARSSHERPTPTSGGVGFVLVSVAGLLWLWGGDWLLTRDVLLLGLSLALALLGLADDSYDLSIRLRIVVQIAVVALMLTLLPVLPPLRLGPWQIASSWLLAPLCLGYGVWQINYYNFMDGIDGLAVSQGLFVALALALFMASAAMPGLSVAALGLACALAGFLLFNAPVARLFMGDVGSNFLGYTLLVLGLLGCWGGAIDYWGYLILMGGFLVDATTTLMGRMREGAVWYHGHRTHAYQLLARRLGSHARVVLLYTIINVAWLLPLAMLSRHHAQAGALIALVAWAPLILAVWQIRRSLLVWTAEMAR